MLTRPEQPKIFARNTVEFAYIVPLTPQYQGIQDSPLKIKRASGISAPGSEHGLDRRRILQVGRSNAIPFGKRRIQGMRSSRWRWHLDGMFVKTGGGMHYLWRAVDHEGEVPENFVTKTRDRKAASEFLRKVMHKHGRSEVIVTDRLRPCGAVLGETGASARQETGRWTNNRAENPQLPFRRRERAMLRSIRRLVRICLAAPPQIICEPG